MTCDLKYIRSNIQCIYYIIYNYIYMCVCLCLCMCRYLYSGRIHSGLSLCIQVGLVLFPAWLRLCLWPGLVWDSVCLISYSYFFPWPYTTGEKTTLGSPGLKQQPQSSLCAFSSKHRFFLKVQSCAQKKCWYLGL